MKQTPQHNNTEVTIRCALVRKKKRTFGPEHVRQKLHQSPELISERPDPHHLCGTDGSWRSSCSVCGYLYQEEPVKTTDQKPIGGCSGNLQLLGRKKE